MMWDRGVWYDYPPLTIEDEVTGRSYAQITKGEGNNKHVYFNRLNFVDNGRYLLINSDRTGSWQIYAYDLQKERIRRLTDCTLDPGRPSVDPYRPLIYYTQGDLVYQLNIETLEEKLIHTHETPETGQFVLLDISRDGQYLGFMEMGAYEHAEDGPADFVRRYEVRPLCSFWVMTSDGAKVWKAHEEKRNLQHLLFCPTDPTTLLFCYEGPWDRVEQRLWLMKWDGSNIRPLRYQEHPDIRIGHEYWLDDGRSVAYAYTCPALDEPTSVRMVDVATGRETIITEHPFCHFINDREGRWIVGDDPQYVTLLNLATNELTPLAAHHQELTIANTLYHPHPAFSPDGSRIVFCRRDAAGNNDVCLISM